MRDEEKYRKSASIGVIAIHMICSISMSIIFEQEARPHIIGFMKQRKDKNKKQSSYHNNIDFHYILPMNVGAFLYL